MDTDQRLLEKFIRGHTGDVLQTIEMLEAGEIAGLLVMLPQELSSLLLGQLDRYKAARCLEKMDLEIAINLIETVKIPVAALILRQINEKNYTPILDGLSFEMSKSLRQILKYPENSVGAFLDPMIFTLQEDLSIGQGLERIKEKHPRIGSHVFILSRDHLLVGFIELKDLIISEKSIPIRSLMNTNPPKILADMNINVLLEQGSWEESFFILPVVDLHGTFLGVIDKKTLSSFKPNEKTSDRRAQKASMALGDLYQIGFTSLVRSASEIMWELKSK